MTVEVEQRRPWSGCRLLTLLGPGGVGKSTVGRLLAPLLGRTLVDQDHRFTARFGHIGRFIAERGYDAYKAANSGLATELVGRIDGPSLFVASSGFLSSDNPAEILSANRSVVASGYGVGLLPSLDPDEAVRIVVRRQMSRGHALDARREAEKVRDRLAVYRWSNDMLVVSAAEPDRIAAAIAERCG